ncbi:MAG: 3-oxoacyl-[acyl-carrier-protein] reductase [Anaerolineales bacterium]
MKLKNKVAVITGAAQGIGRAIATTLAQQGANVVVSDIQLEKAETTAKEIMAETGQKVIAVHADVVDSASVKAMIDRTIDEFERIDILVNNAGTTRDGLIMRMKEVDWDLVLNINLKGTFNCSKAVVRPMMKQHYGRIVNITSVSGLIGQVGQTNYSASKAGIIGFTKALAREVGSRKITVNAIAPGLVKTALTIDLPQELKDMFIEMTPLGRYGEPEDIANAVAFLVSDEASYITGHVLSVDGGMAMV